MSAIFGIIDLNTRVLDPDRIREMQRELAHRGPDGQSLYEGQGVALGHMLLRVTPESVYERQPLKIGHHVIVADARLDEREAIMDRLGTPTAERQRVTDAELLLRSYLKFGKEFVREIYGDFALVIWDEEKREIYAARDQMGIKPLLYHYEDGRFIFSSEMRALVRSSLVDTEVDMPYMKLFSLDVILGQKGTPWKRIHRIPSGTRLEISRQGVQEIRYWEAKYSEDKTLRDGKRALREFRELMHRAVEDRCRVINGVGIPLSGGLDSSYIAGEAAGICGSQGKDVVTVSSVVDERSPLPGVTDESRYIRAVLDKYPVIQGEWVRHTELSFGPDMMDSVSWNYTPINSFYYLDRAMFGRLRKKGVRRVLSGLMGDATVSNSSVASLSFLLRQGRIRTFLKLFPKLKVRSRRSLPRFLMVDVLKTMVPFFIHRMWYSMKSYEAPWQLEEHPIRLSPEEREFVNKYRREYYGLLNLNKGDLSDHIWDHEYPVFTEDWDTSASHYELEITYPWLDRRLVEFLLRLPVEHFQMNGNYRGLIREAGKEIYPLEVYERQDKLSYSPAFHTIFTGGLPIMEEWVRELEGMNVPWIDIPFIKNQFMDWKLMDESSNFNNSYYYTRRVLLSIAFLTFLNKKQ